MKQVHTNTCTQTLIVLFIITNNWKQHTYLSVEWITVDTINTINTVSKMDEPQIYYAKSQQTIWSLGQIQPHLFICVLFLCVTMADLNSCNKDHMAHKAKNIYYLALTENAYQSMC